MATLPSPKIIRSLRRTLFLHVSSKGEVVVKAPIFIPDIIISQFIKEREDWIFKSLKQVESRKPTQKAYKEGEEFLYLGDKYKLCIGDFKVISINNTLNIPDFMMFRIQKELTNWYIKQAQKIITSQVELLSRKMNTKYKSIRFSDTSSKWASCFPDNSLQFNWRLVMAPLMVINYVIIHELAHTIEKNHSRRFWSKVDLYTPAYKQHRKWLDKNKHLLVV